MICIGTLNKLTIFGPNFCTLNFNLGFASLLYLNLYIIIIYIYIINILSHEGKKQSRAWRWRGGGGRVPQRHVMLIKNRQKIDNLWTVTYERGGFRVPQRHVTLIKNRQKIDNLWTVTYGPLLRFIWTRYRSKDLIEISRLEPVSLKSVTKWVNDKRYAYCASIKGPHKWVICPLCISFGWASYKL